MPKNEILKEKSNNRFTKILLFPIGLVASFVNISKLFYRYIKTGIRNGFKFDDPSLDPDGCVKSCKEACTSDTRSISYKESMKMHTNNLKWLIKYTFKN
ncbi:MAG: hypothetical protein ACTSSH_06845 [Candidatus Heimdallarchaeota archaeon]